MKEIVILGAGYAGLKTLRLLQQSKESFHITLVNKHAYHYETVSLHEVATGTRSASKISFDLSSIIDPKRTTFLEETVTRIDKRARQVHLTNQTITYDYLVVSLGFHSEFFSIPGAKENCLELVDIPSAQAIHQHLLAQMNEYRQSGKKEALRVVVCGGGYTGIEFLGSLAEARKVFAQTAGVEKEAIELFCIEANDKIVPMFSEKLQGYCKEKLEEWNVHLLTGQTIEKVAPQCVFYRTTNGNDQQKLLKSQTIIWTTGVSGSEVIGHSGFPEKRGRVQVTAHLTDKEADDVYLLGDVAAAKDPDSKDFYKTTAQLATKMGEYAGNDLLKRLKNEPRHSFSYESRGSVASLGRSHAFGEVRNKEFSAYPASVMKKVSLNQLIYEVGGFRKVMENGHFDFYR